MQEQLNWIQLSDLHLQYGGYETKKLRDQLLEKLKEIDSKTKVDFLLLTGDITYQGKEYDNESKKIINDILMILNLDPKHLFLVPGNHDIKRSSSRGLLLDGLFNSVDPSDRLENFDDDTMAILNNSQKQFNDFYKLIKTEDYPTEKIHYLAENDNYNIFHINTCIVSGRDKEEGSLLIKRDNFYEQIKSLKRSEKLNIAIGHHAIDCFTPKEQETIWNNFADYDIDVYLSGHAHKPDCLIVTNGDKKLYNLTCGALMQDKYAKVSFIKGSYAVKTKQCDFEFYSYDKEMWYQDHSIDRCLVDGKLTFVLNRFKNENLKNESKPEVDLVQSLPSLSNSTSGVTNNSTKIAIFKAQPVDKDYKYDKQLAVINKLKTEVHSYYLNTESIKNCQGFDYVFILTKIIKGKITVEGDYLNSKMISIKDFDDFIDCNKLKGIFIFSDTFDGIESSEELEHAYVVIAESDKDKIEKIFYNLFRKTKLSALEASNIVKINSVIPELIKLNDENTIIKPTSTILSDEIVQKSCNFIGRKTDIENICRKLFDLRDSRKILTLKGSGGIGKTTLIKKIANELAVRNCFKDGIYFVNCEVIKDYSSFENRVAACYDLDQELNFKNYLRINEVVSNKLIIMDNFETLIYLADLEQIKEMLDFISNYAAVVITSREILDLEYEDFYEIREFTSDEAEALFHQESHNKFKLSEYDRRILRSDILEKLLDNNPLAIKLISKNIPSGRDISELQKELENDIFRITDYEELEYYSNDSDLNIERKKSLYASIRYSYIRLTNDEKFVFELLSLFPDGIHTENLKKVIEYSKKSKDTEKLSVNITDRVILSIEKKSMIENNNGFIHLQSIVARFAERQLLLRQNLDEYYKQVFLFNFFQSKLIYDIIDENEVLCLKIFQNYLNNFIKCIRILAKFTFKRTDALEFINTVSDLFSMNNQRKQIINELNHIEPSFNDSLQNEIAVKCIKIRLSYLNGEFEKSFNAVKILVPFNSLLGYQKTIPVENIILYNAFLIYGHEGFEYEVSKFEIEHKYRFLRCYPYMLFRIGVYSDILQEYSKSDFFTLSISLNKGCISKDSIDQLLKTTHEHVHIELMQINYLKARIGKINKNTIKKLVVVNPYTKGIQCLMYALIEQDITKATDYYLEGIENLVHIKYYYVEAIYLYAKFLKENNLESDYNTYLAKGTELATKHYYRFYIHQFKCLAEDVDEKYDERNYPLPNDATIDEYVNWLVKERKKSGKKWY